MIKDHDYIQITDGDGNYGKIVKMSDMKGYFTEKKEVKIVKKVKETKPKNSKIEKPVLVVDKG